MRLELEPPPRVWHLKGAASTAPSSFAPISHAPQRHPAEGFIGATECMTQRGTTSRFKARLLRPRQSGREGAWSFVVLPIEVSETLPRRGRTTISGSINGHAFTALLEPDGQKSHWLRIDQELMRSAGARVGDEAHFEVMAVEQEPEPAIPDDLAKALEAAPDARATWEATTTIARLDWIHWIASARLAPTRVKRVHDACEMLATGKKRVCCFDPSGFYSKAFSAPRYDE